MNKNILFVVAAMVLFFFVGTSFAEITVVSVKGTVAYNSGSSWVPVTSGMRLKEGVKLSTGVKSSAVLKLSNSTVTVKPLSMVKIYEDKITADASTTNMAVKRGGVRAEVNRMKQVKTVFKIATPVATSSVRGTIQDVTVTPNGTTVLVPEGQIEMTSRGGSNSIITNGLVFDQNIASNNPNSLMPNNAITIGTSDVSGERDAANQNGNDVVDGANGGIAQMSGMQTVGTMDANMFLDNEQSPTSTP